MSAHFFLLSGPLSVERLSWLEESLKFYFIQIYPESLMYRTTADKPVFTFFLTGDALSSLENPETQQIWSVILSIAAVRIVCDRQELDLRGISTERIKMKNPGQIVDVNTLSPDKQPSFWSDLMGELRHSSAPRQQADIVGWFQYESPYMHRSALYGIRFLSSALENRFSAELYADLDGVHMGHISQNPTDAENIGQDLDELCDRAGKLDLTCQIIASSHSAAARGYNTFDDGEGVVVSTSGLKSFKIRDITAIVARFRHNHVILAENAGSVQYPWKNSAPQFDRAEQNSTFLPLLIFITKSPYSTEHAYGAISFAAACAHKGILTRVVFIEDGVYALTGKPQIGPDTAGFNIIDILNAVAGNENLRLFALTSSLQKRGTAKNPELKAVLEIGYPGLGKLLFYLPGNVQAEHQRVLII